MRYKKFAGALLGAAMLFGMLMTGCGGADASSDSETKTRTETKMQTETETQIEEETQAEGDAAQAGKETSDSRGLGSFEAKTLDGGTFTQEDIAKKDATLINFWATYCGPCLAEMPDIAELEKSLPENVQIITVCLDAGTDPEPVKEILDGAGYEGVTLIDGDGGLAEAASGIMYIPTTIVVDQDGTVVGDEIIGGQENLEEVFVAAVNEALRAAGKTEIGQTKE